MTEHAMEGRPRAPFSSTLATISLDADCLASAQMIDTGKGGLAGWV